MSLAESKRIDQFVDELVPIFLENMRKSKDAFALGIGSSYGLSGILRGLGLSSLQKYKINEEIITLTDTKGNPEVKLCFLNLIMNLTKTFNRLYEPHLGKILPMILSCFSDSNEEVRKEAEQTSLLIMGNLT